MKPRRKRLIALDLETNLILRVVFIDYDLKDRTMECILEHRSFYPRYGEFLFTSEVGLSVNTGLVYQELSKLELFLTNTK